MIRTSLSEYDRVRARIETLSSSLTLPTVRRALGVLEGEHASRLAGGSDGLMDVHAYALGDEARRIDWKTSARMGRPMIVRRERLATSQVWLLMDVSRPMTSVCDGTEQAWQVAANALRMVAALSLRRSDDVSLVVGDAANITRLPCQGGFARFEQVLNAALDRPWNQSRNIEALLRYATRISDQHCLIVLATDEHAITDEHMPLIRRIARTHPLIFIDVATRNPFHPRAPRVRDGSDIRRRIPAFLASQANADDVRVHREYQAAALQRELRRLGSRMVRADSSQRMFDAFVRMVSLGMTTMPGASTRLATTRKGRP